MKNTKKQVKDKYSNENLVVAWIKAKLRDMNRQTIKKRMEDSK